VSDLVEEPVRLFLYFIENLPNEKTDSLYKSNNVILCIRRKIKIICDDDTMNKDKDHVSADVLLVNVQTKRIQQGTRSG
jgi:hypothetical protein